MPNGARATERLTATRPPSEVLNVARTKVVSWLRAIRLTFPAAIAASGPYESMFKCPLQWRGRIGFKPISVAPVRVLL
jgi:hypothetical protein